MPGGDRTGPTGRGPMTGRRVGYCAGYQVPGYANPGPRFGRGMGFGRGRGSWGRGYYPYPGSYYGPTPYYAPSPTGPEPAEEKAYLGEAIKSMEEELKAMKERLEELSKK